jgi:hypothetical protein
MECVTRMNPTSTAGSEFDEFLYAPIVEESSGMLLSVLSALARLNIDPWDEAARLARLPCDVATAALTKVIAALPNGLSEGLDAGALARQLVALLPRQGATRDHSTGPAPLAELIIIRRAVATCLVLYLLLTLIVLGAQRLRGLSQDAVPSGAAASPIAVSGSSPTQTSVPASHPPR